MLSTCCNIAVLPNMQADSDPFGGDDPFGAPEAAPDATGGGLDDFAPADGGLDDFAPAADGGLDDMFGGGDASAAPADDMFGGNAAPAAAAAPADDMFGGDDLMGSRCAAIITMPLQTCPAVTIQLAPAG